MLLFLVFVYIARADTCYSTDAGRICGISQVEILSEVVHQYNVKVHGHNEEKYQRPNGIFDAIVGSGSAGYATMPVIDILRKYFFLV
jgi:hypothetical protein